MKKSKNKKKKLKIKQRKSVKKENTKPNLTTTISLFDLVEYYPEAVEILMTKYGMHCFGCLAAQFETLEQGAAAHGIVGEEFKKMMKELKNN